MKLKELLRGLDIRELCADGEMEITALCCDSRKASAGSLFVAIRGFTSDGHRFLPAVAAQGASCCVCEEAPTAALPYVLVPDSRRALAQLSKNYYGDPAGAMTMIAFTGTNGKTSSTMLLKRVLERAGGGMAGLTGTNQNMIGPEVIPTERTTPESIELQALFADMRDAGCRYVVMEVSSHSLVLQRVAGIRFAVSVFTNLSQDHLDFHGTMEEYARAKSLLFSSQSEKAVINLDDDWSDYMLSRCACPALTYSTKNPAADLFAKDIVLGPTGVDYTLCWQGRALAIHLGTPGLFSVYNSLGVIGAALALGLAPEAVAAALADAPGVTGRMEVVPTDGDYSILIDYSHTPDALENALRAARGFCPGRLVVLFGCGGDRDRGKRPLMGAAAARLADLVIVTSDNPRSEAPEAIIADILPGLAGFSTPYTVIPERPAAIEWAIEQHQPGDVILLAGKGHELYQEIGGQKLPMDERKIVADCLAWRRAR